MACLSNQPVLINFASQIFTISPNFLPVNFNKAIFSNNRHAEELVRFNVTKLFFRFRITLRFKSSTRFPLRSKKNFASFVIVVVVSIISSKKHTVTTNTTEVSRF